MEATTKHLFPIGDITITHSCSKFGGRSTSHSDIISWFLNGFFAIFQFEVFFYKQKNGKQNIVKLSRDVSNLVHLVFQPENPQPENTDPKNIEPENPSLMITE